jgi:predicted ATPase
MFTKLRLKNFKAWRGKMFFPNGFYLVRTPEGSLPLKQKKSIYSEDLKPHGLVHLAIEVELAPVTVLLGTNSSGKSSLLQSLLLLKQTAASPDRSIHLNLGGDEANDYFNFGHFDDVLTKNTPVRQIEIGFDFRRPDSTLLFKQERVPSGSLSVSYSKISTGAAAVQMLQLTNGEQLFRAIRREGGSYSIMVDSETQPRGKGRNYAPERSIALPAEAIAILEKEGALAEDISLAIRRELEGIAYLGPLRRKPERDYVWNKSKPGDLGIEGNGVINALFASALLRNKDQNGETPLIEEVSTWLKRMGVADKLEVKQLGHSTRYEIVVHKDGVEANLRDVGIGVSQVLPVLTLAFFAPAGSTILLEEPEIHLHPLAQAVLAELFVETSQKRHVQFIVETHSEHLFRRMQTLVAKQKLSINDCRMYFVEREGADAVLNSLELDEYGRVSHWPEKFFGDVLGETREQARLMFERKKQEQQS